MKKKSSIIKIAIIGVITIIGLVLSFCTFHIGLTTFKSFGSSIKLGLDLKGGVYAVYEANEDDDSDMNTRMNATRTRLERLLTSRGYSEATVVREGGDRLRVEVPDVDNPGAIFDIIGKPAELRFQLSTVDASNNVSLSGDIILTGRNILSASAQYYEGKAVVALSLNAEGTEAFSKATSENIGKTMAIVSTVDGKDQIISNPTINVAITNGQAIIDGMADMEAAQELADQITAGQFEVKLSLLENSTVSPTLGEQALFYGIIAGVVGLLLVMAFLIWRYRMLGAVASMALLLYSVLMLFFLAVLPWVQLTLPGIAGIILSIGMAVDANVIIYERIRDEFKGGKSMLASSHAGFKKATKAIIDSNVTTIIAAVVLLIFGTGSIRGFAITLLVGIILSLFTSMLVTRKLVKYFMAVLPDKPGMFSLKRGKEAEQDGNANDGNVITDSEVTETTVSEDKDIAQTDVKPLEGEAAYENI
ncbi:protein translocase subunit SecD [Pumilibacter intestinalis]|uniref:protein translocase subunit SecD n=1 Tax=Pumilibacter intestinalis TaxID=2941511 RepID=UPI00203B571C|nr:protein translocase subunit SecD [Pumilibacter intestinalis]